MGCVPVFSSPRSNADVQPGSSAWPDFVFRWTRRDGTEKPVGIVCDWLCQCLHKPFQLLQARPVQTRATCVQS